MHVSCILMMRSKTKFMIVSFVIDIYVMLKKKTPSFPFVKKNGISS